MSFDIVLCTCNLGSEPKRTKNPFTGKEMEVVVDDGLTDSERAAVAGLLASAKAKGDGNSYAIEFPDGDELDLFMNLNGAARCESGMLAIRGTTPQQINFIFELARAGNLFMVPAMENSVPIVTSTEQQTRIVARWPAAVVARSASELHVLLEKGVTAWQNYRDQVLDS